MKMEMKKLVYQELQLNKESILRELDLLNINESTVFPYIENSAKYVSNKYKFNKPISHPHDKSVEN